MDNRKPQKLLEDGQFAKAVYLRMMSAMKEILDFNMTGICTTPAMLS